MRKPQLWCFDLDDTLMWNENTYNTPVVEFVYYLTSQFSHRIPFIGSIARRQEEITSAMLKEISPRTGKPYGFMHDRFPESLARMYKELCDNGFGEYNEAVAEHCRAIGMTAYDEANYRRLGLVDGANEVLNYLQTMRCELELITKGDPWVQEKKINAMDLRRWFSRIHIVDQKTSAVYVAAIGSTDPRDAVVVGNSFSSDIRPGLDAGTNCIFIPCATWKAESVDTGKLTEEELARLVTLKNIREIIPWYESLAE